MPSEIPATSEVILQTDSSKKFLDALLGQGWSNWGQGLGGEAASELMLQIFGAFNMVALAIISALFIWVSAVAVAGTAHEGVPFGKRYSSLWMPVRFVGAMGALAPIFKGLSLFQVAILACIGWSINLGNYVWDLGADYFVQHAGQITVQAPDQTIPEYNQLTNGMLKSLTLQYYLADRRGLDVEPGADVVHITDTDGRNQWGYRFHNNMGSVMIDYNEVHSDICKIKLDAIHYAIEKLSYIAQQIADPDSPPPPPDALSKVSGAVHSEILKGMQDFSSKTGTYLQSKLSNFHDLAKDRGWFIAGSSYWSISWINQEVRDAMYSGIYYEEKEFTGKELESWTYKQVDFEAVMERLNNYIATGYTDRKGVDRDIVMSTQVVDKNEDAGWWESFNLKNLINKWFHGLAVPWAMKSLATNDPIMAISNLGDHLIDAAWGLAATLGGASVFGFKFVEIIVSFLLFSLFLPLLIYGLTLAYYLPAIPFLRWISALAGWVILIIEALIAAPLWIAAHALPEGEGAAGQHGRRGYILMLAIVIRPPLMIAGFFCAVILMNIMGRLIGGGFEIFYSGVAQTKTMGLTGTCSMLVILGITVIMLANKFFSLIHYIPEHVTNWIGQQMHSLGEREDQAGVKAVFVGSTNAVSSGVGGTKGLSQDVKKYAGERRAAKAAEQAAAGGTISAASDLERSLASSPPSSSGGGGGSTGSSGSQAQSGGVTDRSLR